MLKKAKQTYNVFQKLVDGEIRYGEKYCKTIFLDKSYNEKLNNQPDYRIKYFFELKKIFNL